MLFKEILPIYPESQTNPKRKKAVLLTVIAAGTYNHSVSMVKDWPGRDNGIRLIQVASCYGGPSRSSYKSLPCSMRGAICENCLDSPRA